MTTQGVVKEVVVVRERDVIVGLLHSCNVPDAQAGRRYAACIKLASIPKPPGSLEAILISEARN